MQQTGNKNPKSYLVRLGGAGAVLPFLFVVRRICTLTLFPPVENVDSLDDDVPGSIGQKEMALNESFDTG